MRTSGKGHSRQAGVVVGAVSIRTPSRSMTGMCEGQVSTMGLEQSRPLGEQEVKSGKKRFISGL